MLRSVVMTLTFLLLSSIGVAEAEPKTEGIKHDAEHYLLLNQHRDEWAKEDQEIAEKLAAIRAKNGGKRPNIIHVELNRFADL